MRIRAPGIRNVPFRTAPCRARHSPDCTIALFTLPVRAASASLGAISLRRLQRNCSRLTTTPGGPLAVLRMSGLPHIRPYARELVPRRRREGQPAHTWGGSGLSREWQPQLDALVECSR